MSAAGSRGGFGDPLHPLEALTSDLWYTLIYVTPAERRRIEASRRAAWLDLLEAAGAPPARALGLWRRLRQWAERQEELGRAPAVPAQVGWLSRRLERPLAADEIARRLDDVAIGARVRVATGARPALRRLRDEGYRLGIVSNVTEESGAATHAILERVGLLGCVDSVRLSCDLPWSKPHPGPYRQSLADLGVAPAWAAHLGDLPSDLAGAERAGMVPVWFTGLHKMEFPSGVPRDRRPVSPVWTVGSWSNLLRSLRGGRLAPAPGGWAWPP